MAEIIGEQTKMFGICLCYGALMGLWYDLFRVARRRLPHPDLLVHLEDVFFVVVAASGFFYLLQRYSGGSARFYMVLGMIAGALFYVGVCSPLCCLGSGLLLEMCLIVLKLIYRLVFYPLKLIVNSGLKTLKKTGRTVKIIKSKK